MIRANVNVQLLPKLIRFRNLHSRGGLQTGFGEALWMGNHTNWVHWTAWLISMRVEAKKCVSHPKHSDCGNSFAPGHFSPSNGTSEVFGGLEVELLGREWHQKCGGLHFLARKCQAADIRSARAVLGPQGVPGIAIKNSTNSARIGSAGAGRNNCVVLISQAAKR